MQAQRVPDSSSYLKVATAGTLEEVLGSTRTVGYPLFLELVGTFSPDYELAPIIHFLIYVAAVLLFAHGLRRYWQPHEPRARWLAFWAASALFYSPLLPQVGWIQPDFVSTAPVLMAVGCLLLLARFPWHGGGWTGLVLAVVLAYQMRPAYLFILAWVPLLGLVLWWLRPRGDAGRKSRWPWAWLTALGLAMALPFLAFCGLRLAVMGHFGLVSFGGYNIAGVAGGMIDEELIEELPQEQRELARRILAARRSLGLEPVTASTPARAWQGQYNRTVWNAAVPAARDLYEEAQSLSSRPTRGGKAGNWYRMIGPVNQSLSALSREVLRLRPGLYLQWMAGGFGVGTWDTLRLPVVIRPLLLWLALSGLVWAGSPDASGRRFGLRSLGRALAPPPQVLPLALLAVSFAATALLLVVIVEAPFERYLRAGALFLPSALWSGLYLRCSDLRSRWRGRQEFHT